MVESIDDGQSLLILYRTSELSEKYNGKLIQLLSTYTEPVSLTNISVHRRRKKEKNLHLGFHRDGLKHRKMSILNNNRGCFLIFFHG